MRILYARNLFRPADFGGNRYPYEVTSRLARSGHQVVVVTGRSDRSHDPVPAGVSLIEFPASRRNPLLTFSTNALSGRRALLRTVSDFRPDVIVFGSYDVAYGWLKLRQRQTVPSVFIYHSAFHSDAVNALARASLPMRLLHRPVTAFMRDVQRSVLASVDRIVAVSPFSKDEIQASLGPGSNPPVTVISTGVDTVSFTPGAQPSARQSLGLPAKELVLVCVGRLVPVKRYDRAIHALTAIRERGRAATLMVVGEGPEGARLRALAAECKVDAFVRFEGFRDGPELVMRLQAADLQLCTSEFENWSLSILEGLACGLPVLGTPYGGTPQLLGAIDPRLVLPSGDWGAIADRVGELAADPDRLSALRQRCREYVVERFGWDGVTERLARTLSDVVN